MDLFTNPDLFRYIDKFIHLQSLCDTCSFLLTFKQYITYKLNSEHSFMYFNDILFRQRVLNKIFNPTKQLHLNLRYLRTDNLSTIIDVSALGNVHKLDLSMSDVADVSALGNIHTLNLMRCNKITVSALGNVYTLDLIYCDKITDVSALKNVHNLYLPL